MHAAILARMRRDSETTTAFTANEIENLRKFAARAATVRADDLPEGWSKCRADPMRVASVFASLRVREGYVLHAYQYHWRGNGNGWVWAQPEGAEFPEPAEYAGKSGRSLGVPRPPDALEDPMLVIDGDGTPRSYIEASVLARQLAELGALGLGCDWSKQEILDRDPTAHVGDAWSWQGRRPVDWRPRVVQSATGFRIVFHTYSELGRRVVYRHVDSYSVGTYTHVTRIIKLATNGLI